MTYPFSLNLVLYDPESESPHLVYEILDSKNNLTQTYDPEALELNRNFLWQMPLLPLGDLEVLASFDGDLYKQTSPQLGKSPRGSIFVSRDKIVDLESLSSLVVTFHSEATFLWAARDHTLDLIATEGEDLSVVWGPILYARAVPLPQIGVASKIGQPLHVSDLGDVDDLNLILSKIEDLAEFETLSLRLFRNNEISTLWGFSREAKTFINSLQKSYRDNWDDSLPSRRI